MLIIKNEKNMPNKRANHRTTKSITLDKTTVVFLEQLAQENNTNISNLIEKLIKQLQKDKNEKKGKSDDK